MKMEMKMEMITNYADWLVWAENECSREFIELVKSLQTKRPMGFMVMPVSFVDNGDGEWLATAKAMNVDLSDFEDIVLNTPKITAIYRDHPACGDIRTVRFAQKDL